ncbi:MAG: PA14 domain-containing protein, partial [Anaerolineales bacterium]
TNNGLLGAYYPSPDWSGDPAFMQIDPEIAYYFHIIPLPRPYTVEWTGKLLAPTAGEYRFALDSVDGSQLTLDGLVVVDNPNGRTTIENVTSLTEGWHDIRVRFSDRTSATQIYLYWTPPGATELELVPTHYLLPPMGKYPIPSNAGH